MHGPLGGGQFSRGVDTDQDEAAQWLRSSSEERRKMWQPRHLRERSKGRLRGKDYHDHCERGGHPTPDAIFLLSGHSSRLPTQAVWVELAVHGVSCWDFFVAAMVEVDEAAKLAETIVDRKSVLDLRRAWAAWRKVDRFPGMAKTSPAPAEQ